MSGAINGFCLTGMVKGMHTETILINLEKAFDTLGYKILLGKMTFFGFKTPLAKLFESYLLNRIFSFL